MGKHAIQCFRRAAYHKYIFNIACAGACEWDHTPFLSRTDRPAPAWNMIHFSDLLAVKYLDLFCQLK